jgi:hypothetical protein
MVAPSSPMTLRASRAVDHLAYELPAGSINIIPSGRAHRDDKTCIGEHLPEATDRITARALIARVGEVIKWNEVDFTGIAFKQL